MNRQRVLLAIPAALGTVCSFLPSANGPRWILLGLCAVALVCAVAGDLRAELTLVPHLVSALVGVAVCLIALWKIIQLNSADNEIGTGPYLLAVAGAAITLLPSLTQTSTRRRFAPPTTGGSAPPWYQCRPHEGRWLPPPKW